MSDREIVRSRGNPAFKRLSERKRRARRDGRVLIEGPKLLGEALDADLAFDEVAFSETAARGEAGRSLLEALRARGAAVRLFADSLLASLAEVETTQGVVALARAPRFETARIFSGTPLLLVAWAVQNPGNLGGLLRTAEAAGCSGVVLGEGCADPFSWKSLRGSMGSAFRLPLLAGVGGAELLPLLRSHGVRSVAADARAARDHQDADWRGPLALLVGGEGGGLPASLLRGADDRVAVQLQAPVESLNVGVAAGVLLFEAARQRRMLQSASPRSLR